MLKRRMLVLLALLAAVVALTRGAAYSAVLSVPGDFSTIQAAVDASQPGDAIHIEPGTYYEDTILVHEKDSLTLLGHEATIGHLSIYLSNNIEVNGFNFNTSSYGINITESTSVTVSFCQFIAVSNGIVVENSNSIKLLNNNLSKCYEGIRLSRSQGIFLSQNSMDDCFGGVSWHDVQNSVGIANKVTNAYNGCTFADCKNNSLTNNSFKSNREGLQIIRSINNRFIANKIINNDVYDIYVGYDTSNNVWLGNKYNISNVTPLP